MNRVRPRLYLIGAALLAALAPIALVGRSASASGPGASPPSASPRLDHVFVIVEENHGFTDVIGNPAAPNLNALASQFGVATQYFGVSHPSEPNYVGLLGGNTFGVSSDNAYWTQQVDQPSLITQLDQAGISWKAYLQALPHANFEDICYPSKCNGSPDNDPLYVSKHDAIQNFTPSLNPADWARQVPIGQLQDDLASGDVPAFNYVIPDECHDMHGDPPYCIDGGNVDNGNPQAADPQDQRLVTVGDAYLGQLVSSITHAAFWSQGNNAIAVVFDEGDDNQGCCDAGTSDPNGTGGGQVAAVVVTSHGPRGVSDNTPYNHYSLLSTVQHAFGLGCLQFSCDTANVEPMTPLFLSPKPSKAVATDVLPETDFPTPTPTPAEPASLTSLTPSGGGWMVDPSPLLGTSDNSLGAVAGSGANDVWAVGDYLPDTATSNQDATLPLADHFDGTSWSAVPVPNVGPNFNVLFGVTDPAGQAIAVGVQLDSAFRDRALVDAWNGSSWHAVAVPQPGSQRDIFFSVSATSPSDVWAVGDQQGGDGVFETLTEHWDGSHWSVVPSPDPGAAGNHLYGVSALGPDDAWAVGQQLGASGPDTPLIEHWDGTAWSVVASPVVADGSAFLHGVAASDGTVWAVGEDDDPVNGGRPLVEEYHDGTWKTVSLPRAGSNWTSLWGVTAHDDAVWAVGTFVDPASGNNETLVLRGGDGGWHVVNAPNPGSGSNILGGVAAVGGSVWAVGVYDTGGSNMTLIEHTS
jgi:hypothetical protein